MADDVKISRDGPCERPCAECPWRLSNHGRRTSAGFYRKDNLRRLWNEVRGGGLPQSCHPTDPNHPDHVAAGAKPGSTPKECPGSVIVILREIRDIAGGNGGNVTPEAIDAYLARRKKGIKSPHGMMYWLISRYSMGATAFGEGALPNVDIDEPGIGLPPELASG